MKLVIGGSTGFVGAELVQQALSHPAITSIVALSRRETPVPDGAAAKLQSVVCDDFLSYSDNVAKQLEDADACIWTIAVTPSKLKTVPFEETCTISREYALVAIKTLERLRSSTHARPLHFVYVSGHLTVREGDELSAKRMQMLAAHGMADYARMRGDAETQLLAHAAQSGGAVQACVAKPGMIAAPGKVLRDVPGVPKIELRDAAAALLDQAVNGFEKDTLANDDMVRVAERALVEQQNA